MTTLGTWRSQPVSDQRPFAAQANSLIYGVPLPAERRASVWQRILEAIK